MTQFADIAERKKVIREQAHANRNAQKPIVIVQIKGGKFTYNSTVGG